MSVPCRQCGKLIVSSDTPGAYQCAECDLTVADDISAENTMLVSEPPGAAAVLEPTVLNPTVPMVENQGGHAGPTMSLPPRETFSNAPTEALDNGTVARTIPMQGPPKRGGDFESSRPENLNLEGRNLDGYLVKKKLGAGGMGAVCLATQSSLDRDVALKILPGKFASNPDYLARFTREALSAAQLNHHNVIQVYDVGNVDNIHYIAMEYVRGQNLGEMTRGTDGKLSVEDAASYVLQCARGLLYAHERGIVHRDIKPENIMVNEHGVVKIADMGLAKMSSVAERGVGLDHGGEDVLKQQAYSNLTSDRVTMGTPAFMAPEQGRDASKVDHRADQYSLGCTLYYLVAGKTPFTGKTSFEIISKHATEPLIPIETIVKNVPKELSYIIEKMLAKNPEDRYGSLREVIDALEAYLGVESNKGPYTPREHHVDVLEKNVAAYYGTPLLKMRWMIRTGFFALFGILFLAMAISQQVFLAGAMLGMMVLTPVFHFIINGVMTKGYMFRRVRSVFFGMTLKNWAITVGSSLAVLVTLYFFNLLFPWIAVSVFALGLAFGWEFGLARRLRQGRKDALDATNEMLKQLRIRGVSEEQLQEFVYRFTGAQWEEFFEDLFGYDTMITARGLHARQDKVKPRKKFGVWRDPVFRWLEEIEDSRRKEREKRQLARAEKSRLKATGLDEAAAEREAKKLANEAVEEGLLKTAILAAPGGKTAKKAAVDDGLVETRKRRRSAASSGAFAKGFLLVRLVAAAVALTGLAVAMNLGVPRFIGDYFTVYYFPHGYGANVLTGAAGAVLFLTLFGARFLASFLALAGVVLMAGAGAITSAVGNPQFTPQVALMGGIAMAGLSLGVMVYNFMAGKK